MKYDIGTSAYSGQMVAWYLQCPHCNGALHTYPRVCHPHGYSAYTKCTRCAYGQWEAEQSADILSGLAARRELEVAR